MTAVARCDGCRAERDQDMPVFMPDGLAADFRLCRLCRESVASYVHRETEELRDRLADVTRQLDASMELERKNFAAAMNWQRETQRVDDARRLAEDQRNKAIAERDVLRMAARGLLNCMYEFPDAPQYWTEYVDSLGAVLGSADEPRDGGERE